MSLHSYATSRDKEKRIKSQTCCTNGPRPNLCFFLFFPSRHLVAQGEISRHTALLVLNRFFHVSFTPPLGTEQKSPTYCPIGLRPIFLSYTTSWYILFLSLFFYTTSWHRAEVFDALLKRSTTTMRPDKQNQTPLSEHNGP